MNDKIYIQIASYRDPELKNTIKNCIDMAQNPENLSFCVAWQHDEQEEIDEYKNHPQFQIIDIPYKESRGACWARNLIQQKYQGEKYTLQIDSHHRFVKNWDTKLINIFNNLKLDGYEKPLITSYVPSYDPENDPQGRIPVPWKMNFDRFTPEGVVFFLPAPIDNFEHIDRPLRARFYSAHFAFTYGIFCQEVPHDPDYYFHGEEISIAVRAFTHGYDLFHPTEIIAWHEYTRYNRKKHWDDDKEWYIKNANCHKKNRILLGIDGEKSDIDFGKYGLGTRRSIREYERFAGICFENRSVSSQTLLHEEPDKENECPLNYSEWKKTLLKIFKHCIDIHKSQLPLDDEYDFWAISYFNKDDKEIYRNDAYPEEIKNILFSIGNGDYYNIWRQFITIDNPAKWKVYPHSKKSGRWLSPIEGRLC